MKPCLSRTLEIGIHEIHISHVTITDTFELLSSRPWITHNLQGTMDFQKK